MNTLKMLFIMAIAFFSSNVAEGQTTNKKSKTMKSTTIHYQCPMKCEGEKIYATTGKCPVCEMQMKPIKATVGPTAYQCPMKCEADKTYAKAGKCPKCEMGLKKLEAKNVNEGHEGHNHK